MGFLEQFDFTSFSIGAIIGLLILIYRRMPKSDDGKK